MLDGTRIDAEVVQRLTPGFIFDGLHRVRGMRKCVSPRTARAGIARLKEACAPAWTGAPAEGPRAETNVLMQVMYRLRQGGRTGDPGITDAYLRARELWLSGRRDRASLNHFLRTTRDTGDAPHGLRAIATDALAAIDGPITDVQRYDNAFGRRFESELVQAFINDPLESARAAARDQAEYLRSHLVRTLEASSDERKCQIILGFKASIEADPRPWMGRIGPLASSLDIFLRHPSRRLMERLFREPFCGLDLVQHSYLATQLSTTLGNDLAPWMVEANKHYRDLVTPARSTVPLPRGNRTRHFGIGLDHHPRVDVPPFFKSGIDWSEAKVPSFDSLTECERTALDAGHPIVNGMSGSAAILSCLDRHVAAATPGFSREASLLNAVVFLTYDGGHSLNETLAVEHALSVDIADANEDDDAREADVIKRRRAALADFRLDYAHHLTALPANAAERGKLQGMLHGALDRTLDCFGAHALHAGPDLAFASIPPA